MNSFALAALLTALSLSAVRGATSYYVATNGLDGNLGTISAPFQTIAHGTAVLSAGSTLYIRGGVYRETIQPAISGTAVSPILITAYSNEVVTISGADVVSNWQIYSNSIYSASVNWDLGVGRNQVFLDGQMEQESRFPNFGTTDLLHPAYTTATIASPTNVVTSLDYAGKPDNYWAGACFLGGIGSSWAFQTGPVISSTGSSITLDPAHLNSQWFTGSGPACLFGLMSMLDSDNEWHLDTNSHTLYLQITGGASPNTHLVEVKHRLWTVNLTNVNYVAVNGLKLRAGAVQMAKGNGLAVTGCEGRYLSHFLTYTSGTIPGGPFIWDHGVQVSSTNSQLSGCTVFDTAGSAVFLDGLSNSITRNRLYNISYTGANGAAVNLHGNYNSITFNTISNLGWAGFAPINDSESGHSILYNDVTAVAQVTRDTGVFYSASGSNPNRMHIAYNWFHDVYPWRKSGVLLYLDGASQHMDIDHNVCWNEDGRDMVQIAPQAFDDKIYNNTFFNAWPFGNFSSQIAFTNNLYLTYLPQTQLVDWLAHDFRLKPGAPAIDAGIVIPGVTDGYLGGAPDLGAYEYGGPYWMPGVDGWSRSQPGIYTQPPVTWNATSATVSGLLMSAGTAAATVKIYWGTSDAGTNFTSWANNSTLGIYSTNPVPLTPQLTGLVAATQYFYRFYATNANGQYWGMAQSFTTAGSAWIADASAAWSDSSRWQGGTIPDGVDTMADFSAVGLSADRTVTLDTARTVGALRFADDNHSHDWTLAGGNTLTLSTLNSNRGPSIEVANQSVTISSPLAGTEGLTKSGAGTLTLSGQANYLGNTFLNAGSLLANGSLSNSPVMVAHNATLGGDGIITAAVTNLPDSILSPGAGGVGSVGTLTATNLSLNASELLLDLSNVTNAGGGFNDLVNINGGILNLTPPILVVPHMLNGFLTNRTYLIISNAATITGDVPTAFFAPGLAVSFSTNNGAGPYNIYMTISNAVGTALTWTGSAGAVWDAGSINWLDALLKSPAAFAPLDQVTFDDTGTGSAIALSGTLLPVSVTVNNSSAHPYILQGSGKISGPATLVKTGFGTLTLGAASDYTGPTRVSAGALVLGASNVLPVATILNIGQGDTNNPGAGTLDLSSASQTVGSLNIAAMDQTTLLSTSAALVDTAHITNQIIIGAGQGLTVNGNVVVGDTILPNPLVSLSSMRGAGSFNVQASGGLFQFNGNNYSASSGVTETFLDMSGLANATINLGSGGTMNIGDTSAAGGGVNTSVLTLASNTVVTANVINIGNSQRTQLQTLKLGGGSNVFNVNTVQLGVTRDSGEIFFNSGTGSFKMRAANGTSAATLTIGPNSGTTYGASNQFFDLRGHYADLLIGTLKVGEDNRGSTDTPYSSNYFGFSSGVLNVTTLRIGNRLGNPSSTPALWYNTCDMGGGAVTVGSGGIVMGTGYGTGGMASTNAATLNISGGTITVGNNIVLATQNAATGNNAVVSALNLTGGSLAVNGNILCNAGAGSPASRLSRLNLNGSTAVLNLLGHAIGGTGNTVSNSVNFIDSLNFQSGTLQNIGQINGGVNLVKSGTGTLTIAGTNTYTGGTIISNGTLNVTGFISNSAPLTVLTGTILSGTGFISSPVIISGTLSPGTSQGVLGMGSSLTFNAGSQTVLDLNPGLGTNGSIRGLSSVTYGGTLNVLNLNGTLAGGDSFILFGAAARSGNFSNIILPSLAPGLVWTNRLAVDGSIAVVALPQARPQLAAVEVSGTNVMLTGTGGTPNSNYQVLTSTNLTTPVDLWLPAAVGLLNASGGFTNLIPLDPSSAANFYLLKQ